MTLIKGNRTLDLCEYFPPNFPPRSLFFYQLGNLEIKVLGFRCPAFSDPVLSASWDRLHAADERGAHAGAAAALHCGQCGDPPGASPVGGAPRMRAVDPTLAQSEISCRFLLWTVLYDFGFQLRADSDAVKQTCCYFPPSGLESESKRDKTRSHFQFEMWHFVLRFMNANASLTENLTYVPGMAQWLREGGGWAFGSKDEVQTCRPPISPFLLLFTFFPSRQMGGGCL